MASVLGLSCIIATSYHRQLALAAERASERVHYLERELAIEREARSRERRSCAHSAASVVPPPPPPPHPPQLNSPPPPLPSPSPPTTPPLELVREAARMAMREQLLEAARSGLSPLSTSHAGMRAADMIEWARFEVHEALAAEDPGWCRCPPPPNVTQLCRALYAPAEGSWEREAARARAEVESLRLSLLEASARAQEANELALASSVATARAS